MSIILAVCFLARGVKAGDEKGVLYVQLIRASDELKPPAPNCRRVGAKLTATFQPVLKWKNYWELCCKEVKLTPGQTQRLQLGHGREVEIDLKTPKKCKVTSFQNGTQVERTTSSASSAMTITGGDRDKQNAWFIVVRRDKPSPHSTE